MDTTWLLVIILSVIFILIAIYDYIASRPENTIHGNAQHYIDAMMHSALKINAEQRRRQATYLDDHDDSLGGTMSADEEYEETTRRG